MIQTKWFPWCILATVLTGGALAMIWLTREGLELDRRWNQAQAEADLEQRVSLALWRMDSWLAPLLTREAARPVESYLYRSTDVPPTNLATGHDLVTPGPFVDYYFHWQGETLASFHHQSSVPKDVELSLEHLKRKTAVALLCEQLPDPDRSSDERVGALKADRSVPPVPPPPSNYYSGNALFDSTESQMATSQGKKGSAREDLMKRNTRYQAQAQQQYVQQRAMQDLANSSQAATVAPWAEGVSRPLWIGRSLLLAREVNIQGERAVQGCQLKWPAIRRALRDEVSDLLPSVEFVPIQTESASPASRMLAGLPVRLIVPPVKPHGQRLSPMGLALWGGWIALGLAGLATVALVAGVVGLSEKRASFVSAVTHELRTPLTTFRMYSQMLHRGMVSADQQPIYLETLNRESERLCHLIDNVLTYARLERGRREMDWQEVPIVDLVERIRVRLEDHVRQSGMQLVIERPSTGDTGAIVTDQAAVEQIVFNLVDNASKYARSADDPRIHLRVNRSAQHLELAVEDHGPGLSRQARKRLFRPFAKSAEQAAVSRPGVGLGLSLADRLARQLGGRLHWETRPPGHGCCFHLRLPTPRR